MSKLIMILFAVNITYWGWSEYYIGNGSFWAGAADGLIVSVLCAIIPMSIISILNGLKKLKGN